MLILMLTVWEFPPFTPAASAWLAMAYQPSTAFKYVPFYPACAQLISHSSHIKLLTPIPRSSPLARPVALPRPPSVPQSKPTPFDHRLPTTEFEHAVFKSSSAFSSRPESPPPSDRPPTRPTPPFLVKPLRNLADAPHPIPSGSLTEECGGGNYSWYLVFMPTATSALSVPPSPTATFDVIHATTG